MVMTLLKCTKCGDTINSEGKNAWIDPYSYEEHIEDSHDCSVVDSEDWVSSEPDLCDIYGIQGQKICSNRDKIPSLEDCPKCKVKIAWIERDGAFDYFNENSSKHLCLDKCPNCGKEIFYLGPNSSEYLHRRWCSTDPPCPEGRSR